VSDYLNFPIRAVDIGLDLRDAPDKVQEGHWLRLTNARSTQEALVTAREGRSLVNDYSGLVGNNSTEIHTIKRIGPTKIAVGVGGKLFNDILEYVDATVSFSGNPLSLVSFRPLVSPTNWIYVADSAKLRKIHEDGRIFQWGVTKPTGVVSANAAGTGGLDTSVSGAVAYKWRATYYSDITGAESNPTDEMGTGISGTGVAANLGAPGSSDPQVTHVRFYRTGGTNTTGIYRLDVSVANAAGATVSATSTATDAAIALAKNLSTDNDVPFTSVGANGAVVLGVALPYAAGPFLGKYVFAVGDPNRPGYLYWTNAENPDGAASTNNVQVTTPSEPLIGVFIYDGQPYVWSRDNLYVVEFGQTGFTFRGSLTTCGRGLAAPWAFAIGPEIYFLSKDGIYATTGGEARSITDEALRPIFQGQSAGGMGPVNWLETSAKYIRLWYAGQELHFTYRDTVGVFQHLYWSSQYQRWKRLEQAGQSIISGYSAENTADSQLYLGSLVGKLWFSSMASGLGPTTAVATTDAGVAVPVSLRTGFFDMNATATGKEFGALVVDADVPADSGPITITAYLNGREDVGSSFLVGTILPITPFTSGRRKYSFSLSDTYAYSIAFDVSWSGSAKLYQMELLWRPDEEDMVHWEFPPTSHGLSGWQQERDLYLATRSVDDLTLSIAGDDGVFETYTVPSTGGERRKQIIKLNPRKSKLFRYKLETTRLNNDGTLNYDGAFRIYGEDCELRVKVWNTNMGYDLVSPFKKVGE
jgi:hypothetical protein